MRTVAVLVFSALGVVNAVGQSDNMRPLARSCLVGAAVETNQPRLYLGDRLDGDKRTTFIQINAPVQSSESFKGALIKISPFDVTDSADAQAVADSQNSYVRATISDGWSALLDRVKKGENLTIVYGENTISVSLAGSGAAVTALVRCAR